VCKSQPALLNWSFAFSAHANNVDACLIAVTGDVANSGKSSQYALAGQFFAVDESTSL
jgi:hypothetical protein